MSKPFTWRDVGAFLKTSAYVIVGAFFFASIGVGLMKEFKAPLTKPRFYEKFGLYKHTMSVEALRARFTAWTPDSVRQVLGTPDEEQTGNRYFFRWTYKDMKVVATTGDFKVEKDIYFYFMALSSPPFVAWVSDKRIAEYED